MWGASPSFVSRFKKPPETTTTGIVGCRFPLIRKLGYELCDVFPAVVGQSERPP